MKKRPFRGTVLTAESGCASVRIMLERARRKTTIRLVSAALLLGGLLVSQQASAAEDPKWPGLPLGPICLNGKPCQYTGVRTVGLQETARAKQWMRLPAVIMAANVNVTSVRPPPPSEFSVILGFTNLLYVVSPAGASKPYGEFPPVTVRIAAFGAIPVEATVHVSQVRDDSDLPVPIRLFQDVRFVRFRGYQIAGDTEGSGEVYVRVSDLKVDGVPVDLGASCVTATPARLDLVGKGYTTGGGAPPRDPNVNFSAALGGPLNGMIDLPAFTGCGVGSENLSPMVTGLVSGPDNPVLMKVSRAERACFPGSVYSKCPILDPFPFPNRED